MGDFLLGGALFILATNLVSLFRVLSASDRFERMMAVQLLGSGGAAIALLLGIASQSEPMADVALLLVLLAAFSGSAFAFALPAKEPSPPERVDQP